MAGVIPFVLCPDKVACLPLTSNYWQNLKVPTHSTKLSELH